MIDQIGGWSSGKVGEGYGDGFDLKHLHEWQPYFIGKCPTEFIDARKKAFQRARAALVRKGELVQSNNVYTWTVSGQTSDMSDEHHETDRTDTDTRL